MKLHTLAPVAVLVLLAGLHALAPENAQIPQEATVVTISLDEEGTITVSPDPVVVNRGQTVEWINDPESAVQSWTVRFQSPVPFGGVPAAQGISGNRGERERRGAALSNAAEVGRRYKYMVSVWDGQRVRILDPEVEVGPGE